MVGAVDSRVELVVVQVPFVSGNNLRSHMSPEILGKIFSDRGETTASNPSYVPIWPDSLEQTKQQPDAAVMGTEESWYFSQVVKDMGPPKENKITLQTLFHAIRAEPSAFISKISPKPIFMAVAVRDSLIDSKLQQEVFEQAGGPKQLLKLDCGHFDVYDGKFADESMDAQIAFLKKHL